MTLQTDLGLPSEPKVCGHLRALTAAMGDVVMLGQYITVCDPDSTSIEWDGDSVKVIHQDGKSYPNE